MTREELAKQISLSTGLSKRDSENVIIAFSQVITESLAKGDRVVYSNFGSFYTVHYPSKVIQHPKLGIAKKMVMLPTNAVKWMPSGNIKLMTNNGEIVDSPTLHGRRQTSPSLAKNTDDTHANQTNDDSEEEILNINVVRTVPPTKSKFVHSDELSKSASSTETEEEIIPIKVKNNNTEAITTNDEIPPVTTDNVNPGGIFEESTKDGGRELSTFDGTIKLHRPKKSFLTKIFGSKDSKETVEPNPDENSGTVSLAGAGIFGHYDHGIPAPASTTQHNANHTKTSDSETFDHINTIKKDLDSSPKAEINRNTSFSATTSDISFIDLSQTSVTKEILQKLPEKIARKYKAVPVEEQNGQLVIAMIDPEDIEAKEIIKKQAQSPIKVMLATESDITRILDQYQSLESEVKEAIDIDPGSSNDKEKHLQKDISVNESISNNAPAARIVASMLKRAIREKASDIHIEPEETEVAVRFRIDGILQKRVILPKDIQLAVISRIKILCNMKIDEQRLPQDGRFSINIDDRQVDFRVSSMPVAYGEKIVMRILDKLSGILTIEQLGIEGNGLENLNKNLEKTHGMILVTGPTGSGKTTTLYALIDQLFTEGVNIVTLEDPIEYRMPGINQSQVNSEIDYTFASGLRSIVRQDPDIIMIGEIRDAETADMAVHASLTGHIVLSTLHTNNAAGAAPRLIDMNIEPFLLTSTINAIIGQRLARKICDKCKQEEEVPEQEVQKIKIEIAKMPEIERKKYESMQLKLFKGKGCKACGNSGYKGRIGLYEVLPISEPVKQLILDKKSTTDIESEAIKEGMVTMLQDGLIKALTGKTTLEEVWRVTKD